MEELTLVELQVELEKSRENAALQLREHAEEIENVCSFFFQFHGRV